jgi:hypothetical protein
VTGPNDHFQKLRGIQNGLRFETHRVDAVLKQVRTHVPYYIQVIIKKKDQCNGTKISLYQYQQ